MTDPVWYAAYGSNLAWVRFRSYIHGGPPPEGSTRKEPYPGCRLNRDPIAISTYSIPRRLYFARRSSSWHQLGLAFLGLVANAGRPSLSRAFLIQPGQLEDVVAQENSLAPGRVNIDIGRAIRAGYLDVAERGWYRRVVFCGRIDGVPVLTCTSADPETEVEWISPLSEYLRWIACGLHEGWKLTPQEMADYLIGAPGINLAFLGALELGQALTPMVQSCSPAPAIQDTAAPAGA